MGGRIFVSYRRSELASVEQACALLEEAGIKVWLDRRQIDALDDFPDEIRRGLADAHAVLVWWSRGYAESAFCMQEYRAAWQNARRRTSRIDKRIWIVNPESSADHVLAGELNSVHFLRPPASALDSSWASGLRRRLEELLPEGPFSSEGPASLHGPERLRFGGPNSQRQLIGRAHELARIHTALHPVQLKAAANVGVQLHGIAAIGKTELAAHYADEFAAAYPGGVWWFNLSAWLTDKKVSIDDVGAAWLAALDLALRDLHPDRLATLTTRGDGRLLGAAEVREGLARLLAADAEPYLWVLDDLPVLSPISLRDAAVAFLRAPSALGRTLITTQDARALAHTQPIRLDVLSAPEAAQLLGSFRAEGVRTEQRAALNELAAATGFHPLALILVGEYASLSDEGYASILEQMQRQGALARVERFHEMLRPELGELGPSVVQAFEMTTQRIGPEARQLLLLASVCASNTPIPYGLLQQAFSTTGDGEAFAVVAGKLVRSSLLAPVSDERRGWLIHPLLAATVVRSLDREPLAESRLVADALLSRFALLIESVDAFIGLRDDVAHARAQVERQVGRVAMGLMLGLCRFYQASGQASMGLQMAELAVSHGEREFGASDLDTLGARAACGAALASCGDLDGAAGVLEALLPAFRAVAGPHDRETLSVWGQLADTRGQQHRFAEAETMQRELRDVLTLTRGEAHPDTLALTISLSATLYANGELDEAEQLQQRVVREIAGRKESGGLLGLAAANNLAAMRLARGDIVQARQLQTEVLRKVEDALGHDHPDTVVAMTTLADILFAGGDFAAAASLYDAAVEVLERMRGPAHPATLLATGRSICTKYACGQEDAARELGSRFAAALAPLLPVGHPDALAALDTVLDAVYTSTASELSTWIPLIEQALTVRLGHFGIEHRDTLRTMVNLAIAATESGQVQRARELLELALPAAIAVIGDSHPDTARVMHLLATCHLYLGNRVEHDLMQRATELCLRRFAAARLRH